MSCCYIYMYNWNYRQDGDEVYKLYDLTRGRGGPIYLLSL